MQQAHVKFSGRVFSMPDSVNYWIMDFYLKCSQAESKSSQTEHVLISKSHCKCHLEC